MAFFVQYSSFVPKPAIRSVIFVAFENCIDGRAVDYFIAKLSARNEIERAHVEGVRRFVVDGMGTVNVGETVH